jgi:hypothetical protein
VRHAEPTKNPSANLASSTHVAMLAVAPSEVSGRNVERTEKPVAPPADAQELPPLVDRMAGANARMRECANANMGYSEEKFALYS